MIIKRFALGIRFDFLKDSVTEEDKALLFRELTNVLTAKETEKLHVYGGVFKISEDDGSGIYTVVFTNGGLKKMRNVYTVVNADARLHAMLESRTPFIQNNIVRNFEDAEFFGIVGKDGSLAEGSGVFPSFSQKVIKRPLYRSDKTILLAPNSFKGTISAESAVKYLSLALRNKLPNTTCVPVPVADGGDGTIAAIEKSIVGQRHGALVVSPYGKKIKAEYFVIDGTKAIIESALASGLALCADESLDPLIATSKGTGELVLRAVHEGLKEIYVCLGGSATNDCGIGLAEALGAKFLDGEGNEIVSARDMDKIQRIDVSGIDEQVKAARIRILCDVTNPLTGKDGATYCYGPQKGADEAVITLLESGMLNMEKLLNDHAGFSVCSQNGAGAAGGMGAMLMALFGAKAVPGSEAILDVADFDRKLRNASLVITGEGRIDSSTLSGKAAGAVISRSIKAGVPVALIAGSRGDGAEKVEALVNFAEYSDSESDALKHFDSAAERLAEKIANVL